MNSSQTRFDFTTSHFFSMFFSASITDEIKDQIETIEAAYQLFSRRVYFDHRIIPKTAISYHFGVMFSDNWSMLT